MGVAGGLFPAGEHAHPRGAPADRKVVVAVVGAVVASAWVALVAWGFSPYGRLLSHKELGEVHLGLNGLTLFFMAGWTLMTVAMMLPTSLPLLTLFHTVTRRYSNRWQLLGLVVLGYLAVWTVFGALVHVGDWRLHLAIERDPWLHENAWALQVGIIMLAGLYQFSPLKYVCLDKCRSPLLFVSQHWRGGDPRAQALRLGISHGVFCFGCCWSLMLLMFAVGVGSLGWMLALGTLMAMEKNAPWGRRISAPVGAALLTLGVAFAVL
jgi:predicted metal-binding membrane protein